MQIRKNDILMIIGALLVATIIGLLLLFFRKEGAYVVVSVNGQEVSRHALSEDTEVPIGSDETYNILVIKEGRALVRKASCPDGLCVSQGEIKFSGQSIICLPNKVTVRIVGGKNQNLGIDEELR